ncbi:ATP-binding protein [Paraburkholderia bannensis]|uniref:hypothetical protein n=1 Tax=Paraburkholderia bannensis TaxID=765414 RepID=UPI002AB6BC50|nr:hypothetical protein [Paraburkholderia bannensis]
MNHNEIFWLSKRLSPAEVCAHLLALSVVEFSYSPDLTVALELDGANGRLADTGRGMRLTPDIGDTLSHAERALTGFYPCTPSSSELDGVLRELVWGDQGSPGPSVANAACQTFKFTSKRDREVWSQSYVRGKPLGPAEMLGQTDMTGTVIEFQTAEPIDTVVVARLVEALRLRVPGLSIAFQA